MVRTVVDQVQELPVLARYRSVHYTARRAKSTPAVHKWSAVLLEGDDPSLHYRTLLRTLGASVTAVIMWYQCQCCLSLHFHRVCVCVSPFCFPLISYLLCDNIL